MTDNLKDAASDKSLLDAIRAITKPGAEAKAVADKKFTEELTIHQRKKMLNEQPSEPTPATNEWHHREQFRHHNEKAADCMIKAADYKDDPDLCGAYQVCVHAHSDTANWHKAKMGLKKK